MGVNAEYKVTLSSDFCMGKTEVTVAELRSCRDDGGCTGDGPTPSEQDHRCNFSPTDRSRDDHPVNCLTVEQAGEYCQAQGGDLPTEAQWLRAAQGDDRRPYPWGSSTPDCTLANFDVNGTGGDYENGDGCAETLSGPITWSVGSAPAGASPYGLLDMTGNVFEYLLGCKSAMEVCDGEMGCVDPQPYVCDEIHQLQVIAGGSAWNRRSDLSLFERSDTYDEQTPSIGMRCVTASVAR